MQNLFPIVQGGLDESKRRQCASVCKFCHVSLLIEKALIKANLVVFSKCVLNEFFRISSSVINTSLGLQLVVLAEERQRTHFGGWFMYLRICCPRLSQGLETNGFLSFDSLW